MKKVVIAIACLNRGGTEMQTLQLAKALVIGGYKVSTVCYFESDSEVVSEYKGVGCDVDLLHLSRNISVYSLLWALRKYFKTKRFDIVHVQYMSPGAIPIFAARCAGIKTIYATVHQMGTPYGRFAHWMIRISAFFCTRFICVSHAVERSWFGSSRNDLSEVNGRKHITIYNSIDLDEIDTIRINVNVTKIRSNLGIPENNFVVGAVSRLRYEKGIDILLDAFAYFSSNRETARLLVVGDGPDEKLLKQQALDRDISDKIIWAGKLSRTDALVCMAIMDVVVCPSRFEGFGLTAAEAMAMSKPVIASNVGGLAEVVDHRHTGFLVSSINFVEMADAMNMLQADNDLCMCMGKSSREKVEKQFSFHAYRKQIALLYQNSFK
jgi:glycosyltransferase involved in cell wall biosynthesis